MTILCELAGRCDAPPIGAALQLVHHQALLLLRVQIDLIVASLLRTALKDVFFIQLVEFECYAMHFS